MFVSVTFEVAPQVAPSVPGGANDVTIWAAQVASVSPRQTWLPASFACGAFSLQLCFGSLV